MGVGLRPWWRCANSARDRAGSDEVVWDARRPAVSAMISVDVLGVVDASECPTFARREQDFVVGWRTQTTYGRKR
jgi:hypothetical protein